MNEKFSYHQQISYCGNPRCRKCRAGIGHGPYLYTYRKVQGQIRRIYLGKRPPASIQPMRLTSANNDQRLTSEHVLLRIYTLGQFRLEQLIEKQWQPVTDEFWQDQRVRSLLARLISSPDRQLNHKQMIQSIWPDLTVQVESGTNNLQRVIKNLQQVLEPASSALPPMSLLSSRQEHLLLADQTKVWIDATAFEELLDQAHFAEDSGEIESLLEQAASLYLGDFLPEERYADWVVTRRQRLQKNWLELQLELADLRLEQGNFNAALGPLDRLLNVDPAHEGAVQRLMFLLNQLKRRGEALRAFRRLAAILKHDYATTPSPETYALYEAVRQGEYSEGYLTSPMNPSISPLPSPAPTSIQIGRNHLSKLIGREHEYAILHQHLMATERALHASLTAPYATSKQDTVQSILLMGEAGLGKTRLAEEISLEAQQSGWTIAWSRVYAQESNMPYQLWTEALRKAMAHGLWQRQEVQKHPQIYQNLCKLLPELYEMLPSDMLPVSASPEQEQLRLREAVLHVCKTISERIPLLFVLDDLQWADQSSCELFAYIARRLSGSSILLVGTCRDTELSANHPLRGIIEALQHEQFLEQMRIQPLTNQQINALVSQANLSDSMKAHITDQAGGNPFFAEELARLSGKSSVTTLPDTIAAVLELRISKLSQSCQQPPSKAAVLGGFFEFNWLRLLQGGNNPSNADEDTLLNLLEEALEAGVLTEEGSGTHVTYRFWHPLLVSHLYDKLSAVRRAQTHRNAARLLRDVYSGREEEGAAMIAHHLMQGGAAPLEIAYYAELAGNRAYHLSAFPEAERYFRLALAQREEAIKEKALEDTLQTRLHRAEILEGIGECTLIQGRFADARNLYEQVLQIRSQQKIFGSLETARYEAQLQALLLSEIGWTWRYTGDKTQTRECIEKGEQVLLAAGVLAGPAWARLRYQQCSLFWQEGKYDEALLAGKDALQRFEETLQQQKPIHDTSRLTRIRRTLEGNPVDLGRTHALLGSIAGMAGLRNESFIHLQNALNIFEQYNQLRETAHACCNLGYLYLQKAEYSQASSLFDRALGIADQTGDTPVTAVITSNRGRLSALAGRLGTAEELFKQALTLVERINDREYKSSWRSNLATVLIEQGKLFEASAYIQQALEIARSFKNNPCIGQALVSLSHLRIAQAQVIKLMLLDSASSDQQTLQALTTESNRYQKRARHTALHALTFEGIDAETKLNGHLLLSQIAFLQEDLTTATSEGHLILREASEYELTRLAVCARYLLGNILNAQNRPEEAIQQFEQALPVLRERGLRLEYARALKGLAQLLLTYRQPGEDGYRQGQVCWVCLVVVFFQGPAILDSLELEQLMTRLIHR